MQKVKQILNLVLGIVLVFSPKLFAQEEKACPEYKNTYVKDPLVTENEYRIAKPEISTIKSFEEAKQILPLPIWKGHDKEIEMYWRAWEIAISNVHAPLEGSGFVSSYLDPAYNGNIFMWDTAFMMMFTHYGERLFPFQKSLNNFYAKQHPDGFICREIRANGTDCFERYDPVSTGPNIIPWSEMTYFHHYGDTERMSKVFPVLCAYYRWLKLNRTWRNGMYWSSGWGTGMDNMPRVPREYSMIFSHGHMIWLDTNLQQLFMAKLLLEMGFYLERWQEIEEFEDDMNRLTKYIREQMWDKKTNFLYDQYADGKLCKTKSIGAYWALFTDVLTKEQTKKLVAHLDNPKTFNRPHRLPSITADNPRYKANGRYWQGGVWPSTSYMVLRGLTNKGFHKKARELALNHYQNIFDVYKETATLWEYYAPEKAEQGFMARKDFVGWAGLTPIAELIEYVIGIQSDYLEKRITWNLYLLEEHGIERYPFGADGLISFKAEKRSNDRQKAKITINTNVAFELVLRTSRGERTIQVEVGEHTY